MKVTKYEVVDDNLVSRFSLNGDYGFLSLVDTEVDKGNHNKEDKASGYEDITRFITGILSSSTPRKHFIDLEAFEKYREKHPDDDTPMGGFVLNDKDENE